MAERCPVRPDHRAAPMLRMALAGLLAAVSLAVGCESSAPPVAARVYLIVGLGQDDPLWPVLQAGARFYAGTARGVQLRMLAPSTSDAAAQADLTRENIDRTVAAVCLQSRGDEATRRVVEDLSRAGTPVVLIGRDIPDSGRFGYVGWDEFEAGKALATALKVSLGERTTFMLLHADSADNVYPERRSGFVIGMQEYPFLKELHRFDCRARPAQALRILADEGRRYPQLGAWACLGDWLARVPLEDLRRHLPDGTRLAIIGAQPQDWPLLAAGLCPAAVGTDYGRWGYEAVSLCELAFHKAQAGETRMTPPRIIRAAQLDQFRKEWSDWREGRIPPRPPATQALLSRG